jgi:hypothetical protein
MKQGALRLGAGKNRDPQPTRALHAITTDPTIRRKVGMIASQYDHVAGAADRSQVMLQM